MGDLVLNVLTHTGNTGSLGLSQLSSESYIIPQEPLTKMMFLIHVLTSRLGHQATYLQLPFGTDQKDGLAQRIPCQWS